MPTCANPASSSVQVLAGDDGYGLDVCDAHLDMLMEITGLAWPRTVEVIASDSEPGSECSWSTANQREWDARHAVGACPCGETLVKATVTAEATLVFGPCDPSATTVATPHLAAAPFEIGTTTHYACSACGQPAESRVSDALRKAVRSGASTFVA